MNFNKRTGSGATLKRSSKDVRQKCKVTFPRTRFALELRKTLSQQRDNKMTFVDRISFKEPDSGLFVNEKIKRVMHYPNPSYSSKQYLTRNTVVLTMNDRRVTIVKIHQGHLIGTLIRD